ncbi:Porphobilinogen deaminase, chloroplastic [Galdieria sulphuraria]|nr:Porphobilinogen deaminase, chloroplastic [Galdieria sulphuraria]
MLLFAPSLPVNTRSYSSRFFFLKERNIFCVGCHFRLWQQIPKKQVGKSVYEYKRFQTICLNNHSGDKNHLVLGTRGSPLALAQANQVRQSLEKLAASQDIPLQVEIKIIHTTGDQVLDRSLADIGGKGLFTKEIDMAQLRGEIDIAVHSLKDVPTWLPTGIVLGAVLPREDTRDVFLSYHSKDLSALPNGAVVGSSSLRRQAQITAKYPHLQLEQRQVDATLLALAGMHRLGLEFSFAHVLSFEEMLPAVAQGAIGVTIRENDHFSYRWISQLDDANSRICVECERSFLSALDGSCRTPIAGQAWITKDNKLHFRGLVAYPDGSSLVETFKAGELVNNVEIGKEAGEELRAKIGENFFDYLKVA